VSLLTSSRQASVSVGGKRTGSIYKRINPSSPRYDATFPRPVKIGGRTLWVATELDTWLAAQIAKRGTAGSA
jgi:prophage regulatory protein